MVGLTRISQRIAITEPALTGPGILSAALHFVLPPAENLSRNPLTFFCFPGGSLSRSYFDLEPGGAHGLSFAEAMARRGHVSVLIDHPGIGESSRPENGFALDPLTVARIDCLAVQAATARLIEGLDGYAPLNAIRSIGIGHSMGGMLAGVMQAHHRPFEAIAILGSNPFGAFDILMEPLRHFADDPVAVREFLADTLKAIGAEPYKDMIRKPGPTTLFEEGDERGRAAIAGIRTELLTMCGMFSMIPGAWKPEAAVIDVPLFLAYGDRDLCERPYDVPSCFTASPEITLSIQKDTGHNHFAFASRGHLFDRIDAWARGNV
jgi:pimeloyl-ACP methyl ester carboxylesterase